MLLHLTQGLAIFFRLLRRRTTLSRFSLPLRHLQPLAFNVFAKTLVYVDRIAEHIQIILNKKAHEHTHNS